jgi:hypothetical protein
MEDESTERDERLEEDNERYYEIVGDLAVPCWRFIKKTKTRYSHEVAPTMIYRNELFLMR